MGAATRKPRVALLGAREEEVELLAELHRQASVELVGVYDTDPAAVGLAVAEIAGLPAGSDSAARDRLAQADCIVVPAQRWAYQETIDWCSGLGLELIEASEARRRWGSAETAPQAPRTRGLSARLRQLDTAGERLSSLANLGEWVLEAAMRAVGASGGSLQLLAPDTSELYILAARGLGEEVVRAARHTLGEPISGLTASTRVPQLLHGDQPGRVASQRGRLTSAMSIPLLKGTTLVGVLNVSTTVPGRRFESRELEALQKLGPSVARLLERARQFQEGARRSDDARLLGLLRELEAQQSTLGATAAALAEHLCKVFSADALELHLATEDGDWLRLGSAEDPHVASPLPFFNRSAATRAFVKGKWLHVLEGSRAWPHAERLRAADSVGEAVERALSEGPPPAEAASCVFATLTGTTPVGVLAARFSRPAAAAAFMQHGEPSVRQVALHLESRVRDERAYSRLARTFRLAQLLPTLLEARDQGQLEAVLVREAALLVGAERAFLRSVDEERRTFSRPAAHGAGVDTEAWRALDARVTERALKRRTVQVTGTLCDESDQVDRRIAYRSLVSLPIMHAERLVALLNVYDKVPADVLDRPTFNDFDRELLEALGRTAAILLAPSATAPAPGRPGEPAATAGAGERTTADSTRMREELRREVARAQRHKRELGLSLLHVRGLREVEENERQRLLGEITRVVQDFVRQSDLVGWDGPDRLVIVSPESDAQTSELEVRLRQLLRERLPATSGRDGLEVRFGSSNYPEDGQDASALLQAAAERLR